MMVWGGTVVAGVVGVGVGVVFFGCLEMGFDDGAVVKSVECCVFSATVVDPKE